MEKLGRGCYFKFTDHQRLRLLSICEYVSLLDCTPIINSAIAPSYQLLWGLFFYAISPFLSSECLNAFILEKIRHLSHICWTIKFSYMVTYPITVSPFPVSAQTAIKWNIYGFSTLYISLPMLSALDLNLDSTPSHLWASLFDRKLFFGGSLQLEQVWHLKPTSKSTSNPATPSNFSWLSLPLVINLALNITFIFAFIFHLAYKMPYCYLCNYVLASLFCYRLLGWGREEL